MVRSASIAFLCEGDAETDRAFSGTARRTVTHLRKLGHPVSTLDVELYGLAKAVTAFRTFSPRRDVWKARYRFGEVGFTARSSQARRGLTALGKVDAILQIGATFDPPLSDR